MMRMAKVSGLYPNHAGGPIRPIKILARDPMEANASNRDP